MEGLTEALAELLRQADGGPQPQDLADVLWIAGLAGMLEPPPPPAPPSPPSPPTPPLPMPSLPRPSAAPRPARARPRSTVVPWQSSPPLPAGRTPIGPAPVIALPPPPPPPVHPPTGPHVALHHRSGSQGRPENPGADEPSGHVIRVTQPAALDGGLALARALRPLRRAVDAPGRATLDEEATAEATAETGILLPAWRSAQQPRFSVDLLVDTGATMAVWHRLAGELSTLLERHGAFADVRCWALDTDRPVPTLAPFHRRRPGAPAAARADWSRPLNDPTDRRILLVLTDGVGPAWYGKELPKFLAAVAAARPAAALQVLPRRLWHRTALRTALVAARASVAGRPVPAFHSDAALPGIPPGSRGAEARAAIRWLPVLEVDADWITPWADLTAGRTSGWTPMLAAPIAGMPERQRPTRTAGTPATPAERVARFRAGSSPAAYRLACHLAAAPLSLPVMRLVQRATVPESGQTDLAELFLSGLIAPRGGAATDPDEQVYDFRSGVRKELLAELTRTEAVQVLEHVLTKVSGRVAATFGGTRDFRAVARLVGAVDVGEEAGGEVRLSARSLPFAEVAVTVLASAGGQHAALAEKLAEAMGQTVRGEEATRPGPPPIRPGLLNPVRPVLSPPEPVRMIGRKRELAALAAVFAPDRPVSGPPEEPAVVIVVGAAGMGRRRLVQEYARAYGDRHSFTHWIDAHSADSLERGLGRLWAALSPAGAGYDPSSPAVLWERLARHRDWFLVIDQVPPGGWPTDPGYPRYPWYSLTPQGRGCVLVTTDGLDGSTPEAMVVELGSLDTEEVLDELVARLGPAHDPADSAQATALQRLAQRLPHTPDVLAETDLDAELARLLPAATDPSPRRTSSGRVLVNISVRGTPMTLRLPVPASPARSGFPPLSPAFTGRAGALRALLSFLTPAEPGQFPTRAAVVTGPPGVGKSELVLQGAATVLERGWYPGGALYLDLRERPNPSAPHNTPGLATLLRALNVPDGIVPPDPQGQLDLFHDVLAQVSAEAGPVLLVLDNVRRNVDLAPYLLLNGRVTTLVTSCHSLSVDAARFDLRAMSADDSVQLLRNHLRRARPDDTRLTDAARPAAALAELCDGLPLALVLCAAQLVADPGLQVTDLARELSDPRHRLDAISNDGQSLREAFTASYTELSSSEARLFRLLSVYPHSEISVDVAAGLAGLDILVAEQLMTELARAHVVDPASTDNHWHFHPLLRLFALDESEAKAGLDDRANALTRLLTHYQQAAAAAEAPGSRGSTVRFRNPERARAWLAAERPIMLALVVFAAEHGDAEATAAFTRLVLRLLIADRRFDDLAAVADETVHTVRRQSHDTGALLFLRALLHAMDDARIRLDTLPLEQRSTLDQVFRLVSGGARTNQLHLAVQVANGSEWSMLVLDQVLHDALGASTVDGTLTRPTPGFGAELLLTFPEPGVPLATAGLVLLDLWDRLKRLDFSTGPRTPVAVSVFHGDPPDLLPGASRLRSHVTGKAYHREKPIAAVTVSLQVLTMLTQQFGRDLANSFDLLAPGDAEAPAEGATYLYTGDPQLLGLVLSRLVAGRIIDP
ncbi:SAV_2336 N-terminal domain-related protein [Kitasatospora purpeofusca]|uniref:SAV_2336 N-terminal domain-related protein n=1 Tax=Kitasatospora purpeofusca TaxID=67352 RepID=UPI003829E1B1